MRSDLDFNEFRSASILDTELTARVSKLLGEALMQSGQASIVAVSYTHLTLPTILLV